MVSRVLHALTLIDHHAIAAGPPAWLPRRVLMHHHDHMVIHWRAASPG